MHLRKSLGVLWRSHASQTGAALQFTPAERLGAAAKRRSEKPASAASRSMGDLDGDGVVDLLVWHDATFGETMPPQLHGLDRRLLAAVAFTPVVILIAVLGRRLAHRRWRSVTAWLIVSLLITIAIAAAGLYQVRADLSPGERYDWSGSPATDGSAALLPSTLIVSPASAQQREEIHVE